MAQIAHAPWTDCRTLNALQTLGCRKIGWILRLRRHLGTLQTTREGEARTPRTDTNERASEKVSQKDQSEKGKTRAGPSEREEESDRKKPSTKQLDPHTEHTSVTLASRQAVSEWRTAAYFLLLRGGWCHFKTPIMLNKCAEMDSSRILSLPAPRLTSHKAWAAGDTDRDASEEGLVLSASSAAAGHLASTAGMYTAVIRRLAGGGGLKTAKRTGGDLFIVDTCSSNLHTFFRTWPRHQTTFLCYGRSMRAELSYPAAGGPLQLGAGARRGYGHLAVRAEQAEMAEAGISLKSSPTGGAHTAVLPTFESAAKPPPAAL